MIGIIGSRSKAISPSIRKPNSATAFAQTVTKGVSSQSWTNFVDCTDPPKKRPRPGLLCLDRQGRLERLSCFEYLGQYGNALADLLRAQVGKRQTQIVG